MKLKEIKIFKVLGFRGIWTVKIVVFDENEYSASIVVPIGKSKGKFEVKNLDPDVAILKSKEISDYLKNLNLEDQETIDNKLVEFDKTPNFENLGGNVALGISLACARLASINFKIPFYKYLYFLRKGDYNSFIYKAPRILFNIAEGGVHADNNLEFQEHLVSFKNQAIFSQIQNLKEFNSLFLNIIKRENKKIVFGDEGGWAGNYQNEEALINTLFDLKLSSKADLDIGLDIASSSISNFEPKIFLKRYLEFFEKFGLFYFEDPFPEEGFENFYQDFYAQTKNKALIVGDDLISTNPELVKIVDSKKMINGVIVKPDQVGTLSKTLETIKLAKENNWRIVVSHRSQETLDNYLADLAIGAEADFVKFGAFYQGERLAKYNRLLEIESEVL